MDVKVQKFCELGKAVIATEAQAIAALESQIDDKFAKACEYMLHCEGRVVVTGMGKSGHIGNKIAATFASTGTPAFFVHPGEASHGDLGMLTHKDVVVALSYSGSTEEIIKILPVIKILNLPLISLTGNPKSELAQNSHIHIDISVEKEACPLGLAPTSSTTAMLAMGDALAIALLESRGFTAEDFALSHPGGNLGRRLLLRVSDLIHSGEAIPAVTPETSLAEALIVMTEKRLGMTTITDSNNKLIGVFTDGDLRRALDKAQDMHKLPMKDVMTSPCKSSRPKIMAVEALQMMEKHLITSLPVTDNDNNLLGVIHLHDILRAGIV